MPKVTIYLPDELADQARSAGLSLSPLCQQAIRKELDKVKAQEAVSGDLEAVAARLRGTIDEEDAEQEREGREDGIQWAREYASARELQEIAGDFMPGDGGDFEAPHSIVHFFGAKDGQNVISVRHQNEPYWHGFVAGAGEVFERLRLLL